MPLAFLGTLLAHVQPAVNQHPKIFFHWAAFQPLFPKPVVLHGVAVTQVPETAFGLVESLLCIYYINICLILFIGILSHFKEFIQNYKLILSFVTIFFKIFLINVFPRFMISQKLLKK